MQAGKYEESGLYLQKSFEMSPNVEKYYHLAKWYMHVKEYRRSLALARVYIVESEWFSRNRAPCELLIAYLYAFFSNELGTESDDDHIINLVYYAQRCMIANKCTMTFLPRFPHEDLVDLDTISIFHQVMIQYHSLVEKVCGNCGKTAKLKCSRCFGFSTTKKGK